MPPFERLAAESFAYLTTTGRVSGRAHTIEIWFSLDGPTMYLLSGGGDKADWVKNIRKHPDVRIRVGTRTVPAKARVVRGGTAADTAARELLDGKYMGWRTGKRLSSWARGALPVAIELPD